MSFLKKLGRRLKEPSTSLPIAGAVAVLVGVPEDTVTSAAQLAGVVGMDPTSLKSGVALGLALGALVGRKEKKTLRAEGFIKVQ